ncbi:MAG: division/cell wall cluster transcriptional repressor MraZ [Planctomycetota bacterium]
MSLPKTHHPSLDVDESGRPAGVLLLEPTRQDCIWVVNDDGFDRELAEFVTPEAGSSPEHRDKQRALYRWVTNFSLDKSGRLTLPDALRKKVGIEGDAMVVGMDSRLEIWPKATWEERYGDASLV